MAQMHASNVVPCSLFSPDFQLKFIFLHRQFCRFEVCECAHRDRDSKITGKGKSKDEVPMFDVKLTNDKVRCTKHPKKRNNCFKLSLKRYHIFGI